jgi:hypothetical protein
VHLLLSFMGATLGWAISWRGFIDTALLAYFSGLAAQDLFDALEPAEFAQVGSIFRVAGGAAIESAEVNAEAFARCGCDSVLLCCACQGCSGFALMRHTQTCFACNQRECNRLPCPQTSHGDNTCCAGG